MSNDKTTLADVQPGGRVRLGDGVKECSRRNCKERTGSANADCTGCGGTGYRRECNDPDCAEHGCCGYGKCYVNPTEKVLSAQPSPGGQGDSRSEKAETFLRQYLTYLRSSPRQGLRPRWCDVYEALEIAIEALSAQPSPGDSHHAVVPDTLVNGGALKMALNVLRRAGKNEVADELESTAAIQPSPGGQDVLDCIGRIEEAIEFRVPLDIYAAVHGELAELKAALAARQPVGENAEVSKVMERCIRELQSFIDVAHDYDLDEMAVQALRTAIESMEIRKQPAQAVDLGRIRSTVQALLNWIDDWAETPEESGIDAIEIEAAAVLALIDSQGVGNG